MSNQPSVTVRTRIVCISDTHNRTPSLPAGDILVHAGDLTNQGSYEELKRAVEWLERQDFEAKVVIAGNHDINLDSAFSSEYGSYFHNTKYQSSQECISLFTESKSLIYLNHESTTVRLSSPQGPQTICNIFGSPLSPAQGLWAFGYQATEAENHWSAIPLNTDVLITHTPPKYHVDESGGEPCGCPALREALWRVRPRLHICGHVHSGRGAERLLWDLNSPHVRFKEKETSVWHDKSGGTKKIAKVDLTERGGAALRNNGSGATSLMTMRPAYDGNRDPSFQITYDSSSSASTQFKAGEPDAMRDRQNTPPDCAVEGRREKDYLLTSDLEALAGRRGREETCIVNAAIMADSWSKDLKKSQRKLNKPIVVDLDLPVWVNGAD